MNKERFAQLAEEFLAAWNSQETERVLACYTDRLIYRDPNLTEAIDNKQGFRKYLDKLFGRWQMTWALKEFHSFRDELGGAFLWRATFRLAGQQQTVEAHGMDLVLLDDNLIKRNEVYFDRAVLAQLNQR